MRSTSAVKKRVDSDRWTESRVLATSNTMNPLSRNVSSKLDLIKQEISREFHEKFPSDKKRSASHKKKASSFKVKTADDNQTETVSRKLNYNISEHLFEPQQHNLQNRTPNSQQIDEYEILKEKFYEMQEKFLCERQKSIDNYEKNSLLKENIICFLEQPSQMTANNLRYHFPSEKHQNIVNRFIMMNEDIEFAESTLGNLMTIMEVKDIETLLAEIKNRHTKFKSLRECSERILELETAYNKLKEDSEARIDECIKKQEQRENEKELEIEHKIQIVESSFEQIKKEEMSLVKKMLMNLIKEITKTGEIEEEVESKSTGFPELSKLISFGTFDKNVKKKEGYSLDMKDRKVHFGYEVSENLSFEDLTGIVHNIFKEMSQSLEEIEKEAEQNYKKLINSNLDLARLEDMIENVTNETIAEKEKEIEDYEVVVMEKERFIELSNEKWEKMILENEKRWEEHVEELEAKNRALEEMGKALANLIKEKDEAALLIQNKEFTIHKIIRIVSHVIGDETSLFEIEKGENSERSREVQEGIITRMEMALKRHIFSLKEKLESAESMMIWHEKELEVKEGILKEFEFNLKKLMEDCEEWEEKEKEVRYERDEYKYLLTNLRENIRDIKKEYEQKLIKVANDKDEEYLNSNKDILIHNQQLYKEINNLKAELKDLTEALRQETASNAFNKNKSQSLEESLGETKKVLLTVESERSKLKQMLNEIEVCFKEVENMSDMNSEKIIVLEEENQLIANEKIDLEGKKNLLIKQIEIKDNRFNELQCSYEELKNNYEKVIKIKQDFEKLNSNLRMEQLETISEMRANIEEANKIQHENTGLKKENKKLLEEIGSLTRRMMVYVENKSKVNMEISKASEKVRRELRALKNEWMRMKKEIKNELSKVQRSKNEEIWQMTKELNEIMGNKMIGKALNTEERSSESIFELKKSIREIKEKFNELNKEVFEEFEVMKSSIQNFGENMKRLKLKGNDELNKVVIAKLKINSCKNEIEQTREMILKEYEFVQEEFNNFGKAIFKLLKQSSFISSNSTQNEKIQNPKNDHFKYLTFKNDPQSFDQENMEYQSPQFVRIRKSTVSEENESEKFEMNEDDGQSERMDKVEPFPTNHPQESEDEEKLGGSWLSNMGEEVKKVKKILWSLTEKEDPKVDYFDQIKTEYRELKRKLLKNNFNLDISAVSFRHNTVSSPSSVSFSKDYVFDKRFHTDPNEEIMTIGNKETNRSDYKNDRSVSALKKENEILREHIEKLEEDICILREKEDEYKIQISELAKRNTELENESSTQMKKKLFLKFLDELIKENWKDSKASCRTFLKLLGLPKEEIDEKMDNFEQLELRPKKKVNNGFMAGLFQGNSKN